jgi:hypothetical protein
MDELDTLLFGSFAESGQLPDIHQEYLSGFEGMAQVI